MVKAERLKGYGLIAVAANSIKDDAKLGARVREIVAAVHAEIEAHRSATPQPPANDAVGPPREPIRFSGEIVRLGPNPDKKKP